MAILTAYAAAKHFGERVLFSNVSFEVQENDKIGFVGLNGCGKTTLLRMLCGKESVDAGSVSVARGCRVRLLEQTTEGASGGTLYDMVLSVFMPLMDTEHQLADIAARIEVGEEPERLVRRQAELFEAYERDGGLTYRARTRSTLLGLGFTEAELARPPACFSGGELRKAALARMLLSNAELLLLDEPTNHLDIAAVEWLEDFLRDYRGAYIVVSHDRYFLDRVTTRTMELQNGALRMERGNYSRFIELKLDRRETALRAYRHTQREIKRIESIIDQQRRWNQARNYVTIASKQKQIDRLKATLVEPEPLPPELRFLFRAAEGSGNEVLKGKGLKKTYGDRTVFENVDFLIQKDERVCLLGSNGCGKTTLLKILTGAEEPDAGTYVVGANVQPGYYEQTLTGLNPDNTVLQELWDSFPRLEQKELRNALGLFLFRGDDVFKPIAALSGGERARVQLLKLMLAGSNLLMLDEPTNHLDIRAREALENALSEYGGTMLIVTHDRYFVNRVADRILVLGPDGVTSFIGGWDEYREAMENARDSETAEANDSEKKSAYALEKERRGALARQKGEARRAENAVSALEAEIQEREERLLSPEIACDYERASELCAEIAERKTALEAAYHAWMDAETRLNTLTEDTER